MSSIWKQLSNLSEWVYILLIVLFTSIVIVTYYYRKDVYEPEPKLLILYAFFLGMLSVIPSFIVELLLLSFVNEVTMAVIVAPITEEFFKYWMVIHLSKQDAFDGPLDGLIYGAVVGCGFAGVENILYGLQELYSVSFISSIFLTSFRSVTEIIGHPFFTGLIGVSVGKHKVKLIKSHKIRFWRPISFHAIWNFNVVFFDNYSIVAVFITLVVYLRILGGETKRAFELDKKAYEEGYYHRKRQNRGRFDLGTNWTKYAK